MTEGADKAHSGPHAREAVDRHEPCGDAGTRTQGAPGAPTGAFPALPGVLAQIAQIAGREAALALALACGGQQLYVPRPDRLDASHRLVVAVGPAAAGEISAHFAGEMLKVPMARREAARHLAENGLSRADIATRLGCSRRAVQRYLQTGVQPTIVG